MFIKEAGEGLQIVATWTVLVTIKHPEPARLLTEVPALRDYINRFRDVVHNVTLDDWTRRLDVIEDAVYAYRGSVPVPPRGPTPPEEYRAESSTTNRTKRGLFDGVSKLGNWMFGFATQAEIDELGNLIKHLHDDYHYVTHSINRLVTVVNKTVEAVNRQSKLLKHYEEHLQQVTDSVINMQSAINRNERRLNRIEAMNIGERVVSELETVFKYWERECDLYLTQLRALERGWLTFDLLNTHQLIVILEQQRTILSTKALPLYWYYMNTRISLLMWKGLEFVYKAELPTVNEDVYVLYDIVTIPVHTGVKDIWRQVIDLPSKIGWNSRRGGTIKSENCYGARPIVCPPEVHHRHGRCLSGVLTGRKTDLEKCTMKMFTDTRQDIAHKLSPNIYLISSRNQSTVRIHCIGKPERQARIEKVKVYSMDADCSMETDSWRVIGEHTRVVSIDYQREAHNVKSITLGFDISKLTDFVKIKKLVSHQPIVVRAGDLQALYIRPATMPRKVLVLSSSLVSTLFVVVIVVIGVVGCYIKCCRKKCAGCTKKRQKTRAMTKVRASGYPTLRSDPRRTSSRRIRGAEPLRIDSYMVPLSNQEMIEMAEQGVLEPRPLNRVGSFSPTRQTFRRPHVHVDESVGDSQSLSPSMINGEAEYPESHYSEIDESTVEQPRRAGETNIMGLASEYFTN